MCSQDHAGRGIRAERPTGECSVTRYRAKDVRDRLSLGRCARMCKNPQVQTDRPDVAELVADVAAVVARRATAVSEDVYEAIVHEIPQLRDDRPVLTLL